MGQPSTKGMVDDNLWIYIERTRTRGKLLRNSGLTPEEYRKASRDNQNDPITIDEMKKKNKAIADYLQRKEQGV